MFASSVHVSGFYPWGRVAAPSDPIRPDTFHALSKVTERVWEACTPTATASRSQSSDRRLRHGTHRTSVPVWLAQPRRPSALVTAALAPYRPRHLVLRAARNTRRFYTEDGWADLGYHPPRRRRAVRPPMAGCDSFDTSGHDLHRPALHRRLTDRADPGSGGAIGGSARRTHGHRDRP